MHCLRHVSPFFAAAACLALFPLSVLHAADVVAPDCEKIKLRIENRSYTDADLQTYAKNCQERPSGALEMSCRSRIRTLLREEVTSGKTTTDQTAFAAACPGFSVPHSARFPDEVLRNSDLYSSPFSDAHMDEEEGKAALEMLRRGVITGQTNGTLGGSGMLTRAEGLKIAMLTCGVVPQSAKTKVFDDVDPSAWFAPYVAAALHAHVLSATATGGMFRPNATATRAEFGTFLVRACALPPLSQPLFSDVRPADWFAPAAGAARKMGLFDWNRPAFEPSSLLRRKDGVVAAYRLLIFRDALLRHCPPSPGAKGCIWKDKNGKIRASSGALDSLWPR